MAAMLIAVVTLGIIYARSEGAGALRPRLQSGDGSIARAPEAEAETPVPPAAPWASANSGSVAALGRLEPRGGIRRISGPSDLVVVVDRLLVKQGDRVKAGDLLAVVDTEEIVASRSRKVEAELGHARRELERSAELNRDDVLSDSVRERWETEVAVLEAELRQLAAELERTRVYSPIDAQVLEVHTHPGERVGEEGILELARTQEMIAVAEVYETDIGRVRRGQTAVVSSPALPQDLTGRVGWINLKVAKQDALGTDPAARKDARVVEVDILLEGSRAAAALTNLQVEILIDVTSGTG